MRTPPKLAIAAESRVSRGLISKSCNITALGDITKSCNIGRLFHLPANIGSNIGRLFRLPANIGNIGRLFRLRQAFPNAIVLTALGNSITALGD